MNEIPKAYNPAESEPRIYKMWERSVAFNPDNQLVNSLTRKTRQRFSIIMPPPNANGSLHIGHAVGMTLEDIMVRYHRMKGDQTLWLPGADHAGFETQVVFERKLEKEGKSRFDFSKDDLYKKMHDFTQANRKTMEDQTRKLGASCDWSRKRFTLDPAIVEIVYQTFKKLYEDGLAYRGQGTVNWCPKHQTSLSDLEVKYIERVEPLYYFKYGPFTIATARPETKFGDKYVVVHPKDRRYGKYKHGQKFEVEWINGKVTAALIKDEAIDMNFGSGVMTITPWHDAADFEIAKRHKLDFQQIIGFNGRLLEVAGPLEGLRIRQVREEVIKILQKKRLVEKIDNSYAHAVAVCYKCGTEIEPQVLTQWHIAMTRKLKTQNSKLKGKSLRDLGLEAVQNKQVVFVTKHFEKIYRHWLENIKDWNLSRQIVWGIPINAWYCGQCRHTQVDVPKTVTIFSCRHGEAEHNAEGILNGDSKKNYDLTRRGQRQAVEVGETLKGEKIEVVYVSEFLRTQKTGEEIAKHHGLKITIDKRLNEIKSGGLEGEKLSQARERSHGWTLTVGGSETAAEVEKRVLDFVSYAASRHNGKAIAIVSSDIALHAFAALADESFYDPHFGKGEYKKFRFVTPLLCERCGGKLERDPDVFDTWFSSVQWPFATLLAQSRSNSKIKNQNARLKTDIPITKDYLNFYPTSVMETGHDILFFWVARMIMLGLYVTGESPFKYVYLHGLVRDKDRQKMSKSKGNVIDPLGVASEYGADAVRMALIFGTSAGQDIVISEEKIKGMRNFANKIWNINRFIAMKLNSKFKIQNSKFEIKSQYDEEILTKLKDAIKKVTADIEKFRFHEAAEAIYRFIWHEFADKYIEQSKRFPNERMLLHVLKNSLVLLHPFMPFVTEAIWQNFCQRRIFDNMLVSEKWPK